MGTPTGRHVFCSSWAHFGNNADNSDSTRPPELQIKPKKSGVLRRFGAFSLLATLLAACKPAAENAVSGLETGIPAVSSCGDSGYLRGRLYGAIDWNLDFAANKLQCEGMPRPGGEGARLRFAGRIGDDERQIAIIIAIPELDRGSAGSEYVSNVTVIEEGRGRFFNTVDPSNCLTDITAMTAIHIEGDRYTISGSLYCLAPLAEVNGDSSVSITELRFEGLIDWSAS